MKNVRTLVALLLLVLAAAAANVWLYVGPQRERLVQRRMLVEVAPDLAEIRVRWRGAPTTVLVRATDGWRMRQPFAGEADGPSVLKLLDAIAQTQVVDTHTTGELEDMDKSRADFGLAEPALRLELVPARGDATAVNFGAKTPTEDARYASIDGAAAVFVVRSPALATVGTSADAFRRRSLFSIGPEAVTSFDIKREGASVLAFARADAGWQVAGERGVAPKISAFLSDLTSASALRFAWPVGATNESDHITASLLAGYGLAPDVAVTVSLMEAGGGNQRISFGRDAAEGEVFALAQNGSAIVTVPAALRDFVRQDFAAFVDTRVFPVKQTAVDVFSLAADGVIHSLVRGANGRWRLESPIVAPADQDAVEAWLSRLLMISTAELDPEGDLVVTVGTNLAKAVVRRERVLGEDAFESLRALEMLAIDPTLVKRLVRTRAGEPSQTVVFDRDKRQWNVEKGTEGATVDGDGVKAILAAVNPLKALRVERLAINASDLDDYGLDEPYLTIAIDQDSDEAVRRNLLVGKQTKGGRFATIGSADAIFVLPDVVVKELSRSLWAIARKEK